MTSEYSWPDVEVLFDGGTTPVIGVARAKYTSTREHFNIHGKGSKPVAISKGKKDYNGEFMFLQSAIEALIAVLPADLDPTDAVYNLTVSYAPQGGGVVKTDRLEAVRFPDLTKDIGVDNPFMQITMPAVIGNIKYNV